MKLVNSIEGLLQGSRACVPHSTAMYWAIAATSVCILIASVVLWDKVLPTKKAAK